ncbi:hypothetical protein CALCODRAFT_487170 [Calocera cornea HHB12733]|uniref:Integrase core domain-containing protein n=1 Tax=Calocera cornea HHB12733 TaxID=1353952 RepID=A0A165D9Z6_9BASI|nr:hypothetical protein CALCODRAFT_487170 [Calocera cornea HHB12733]
MDSASEDPAKRHHNQYRQAVPDHVLRPLVEKYYKYGYGDKNMLAAIKKDIDLQSHHWTLSTKTLQRRRKQWGFLSARQQGHNLETVAPFIEMLRLHSANQLGAKSMRDHLRDSSIMVSRHLVLAYQQQTDPVGNKQRLARRLKKAVHWSAGAHERWSMDQHDKWRRFGLFLHVGIENFSNAVLWLKVWWTNSNPRLITRYYLEAATNLGGIPMLTQSDPGTENHGVANAQTTLRRQLDPTLVGTLQHQWMRGHTNIKPEIFWSKLRHQWSEGWERMFEDGLQEGWYDPFELVESMLFRWLAVPMIQVDLDRFARIHNSSRPRQDRHKAMPAELPLELLDRPEEYGPYRNYKITVSKELLKAAEEVYAPADHEVFQLVPELFDRHAAELYLLLGKPQVNRFSFWGVYLAMLEGLQTISGAELSQIFDVAQERALREAIVKHEFLEVIPGQAHRGPAMVGPGLEESVDQEEHLSQEVDGDGGDFSEEGCEDDLPVVELTEYV